MKKNAETTGRKVLKFNTMEEYILYGMMHKYDSLIFQATQHSIKNAAESVGDGSVTPQDVFQEFENTMELMIENAEYYYPDLFPDFDRDPCHQCYSD